MALRSFSIALLTLFTPVYTSIIDHGRRSPTSLTWGRCPDTQQGSRFECAIAEVPLDWNESSKGTISLSVIRLPAKGSTREGYMFFNPGGPGYSGTTFLEVFGEQLQTSLGDGWDVLSWDPRGVLQSGPNITMFSSLEEYYAFLQPFFGATPVATRGNLTQSTDVDVFMSQVSTFDNLLMKFNERMINQNGDKLKYVGTCANVRDLVHLVDSVYGEGSDVNFWGTSYGTIMGTYLAQMFPDRVGRVILDAVLDPERHSNQSPISWMDVDYLTIDRAVHMWTQACISNPQKCQLAKLSTNATAEGLLAGIDQALDAVHDRFNVYAHQNNTGADTMQVSWDFLARNIRVALYDEDSWYNLDDIFKIALDGQNSRREKHLNSEINPWGFLPYASSMEVVYEQVGTAIYCSDTIDSTGETTEDLFKAYVRIAQTTSKFASSAVGLVARDYCHRFTSRAVERLRQPINKKPKNVVLVMGSTGDLATPYGSARQLASSSQLGSKARLLQLNAPGHGVLASDSSCVTEVVRKFVRGTPPEDRGNDEADVVCDVDSTPYGPAPESWRNSTALSIPRSTSDASMTFPGWSVTILGLLIIAMCPF